MEKFKEYTILFLHLARVVILSTIISYFLISIMGWDFDVNLWSDDKWVIFRLVNLICICGLWFDYLHGE